MRITFADLWRPSGTADRITYLLVGTIGIAIKHNLDRFIAGHYFHRYWGLLNYWVPVRDVARVTQLRGSEAAFIETMVAIALPFVWVGVCMTLKRLRSAGLPLALVALFFVPFLNLLFFLGLALWPEQALQSTGEIDDRISRSEPAESFLARFVPKSAWGSAVAAVLITAPIGLLLVLLGVQLLMNYGWGLFIALPFVMGFVAAVIHGLRRPRTRTECIIVATLSMAVLGTGLLAFAIEGAICIAMAAPIAVPLAAFGGMCGYLVQRQRWSQSGAPAFLSIILLFVPGVQWTEHALGPARQSFVVRSAIEINAPPEKVWQQVVAFSEISPPKEWLFRAGIAYPIRAEIAGHGPGAERHCVFSTGAFVEPIEIWDEPRQLKFSVTANPPPMEEWSPYAHIAPPHLHGFLVSNGGQFLLTPLPGGRTRLEGTTWYRHGLAPAGYWRLWSDVIIHKIHMRVLTHIKEQVEKAS
ncbi:MAG TPA: hypothetical protein VGU90_17555 [Terriglobales bacterium]|nr:hypothetical protein [Terriglobales bacterium]